MHYQLNESARARHLRISINPDGVVILTKPVQTPLSKVNAFVEKHSAWITSIQKELESKNKRDEKMYGKSIHLSRLRRNTTPYLTAIKYAKRLVEERVQNFADLGGYKYKVISIRNQKTRWGSCSAQGILSFNYRLIYLTPEELDYLVVHELAHTKHHNHGKDFWLEVERFIPEYKNLRNSMRRYKW